MKINEKRYSYRYINIIYVYTYTYINVCFKGGGEN